MTEEEWLNGGDLEPMLGVVRRHGTDRQHRHLMTAFVAHLVSLVDGASSRKLLQLLGQFASGAIPRSELHREWTRKPYKTRLFDILGFPWASEATDHTLADNVEEACLWVFSCTITDLAIYENRQKWCEVSARSADDFVKRWISDLTAIVHDVMGNPFRSVSFDPTWRTEAVVAFARGMYESQDFAPMPVLADALEDAGCADADILAHCRGAGPHIRGCWVVDLVLGKE